MWIIASKPLLRVRAESFNLTCFSPSAMLERYESRWRGRSGEHTGRLWNRGSSAFSCWFHTFSTQFHMFLTRNSTRFSSKEGYTNLKEKQRYTQRTLFFLTCRVLIERLILLPNLGTSHLCTYYSMVLIK
jgi:hypothetical protein